MKRNLTKISDPGERKLQSVLKFVSFIFTKPGLELLKRITGRYLRSTGIIKDKQPVYNEWIKAKSDTLLLNKVYEETIGTLKHKPKISIIISVDKPQGKHFAAAIGSITSQLYPDWELCIADHYSPNPAIKTMAEDFAKKDERIKVLNETNSDIAINANAAISLAHGGYLLFMSAEDLLIPDCLFEFVKHINTHPADQLIYADEDTLGDDGIFSAPHFKPDWAPDSLLSRNYIGHVIMMTKDLVNRLNGFRTGFDGSQYYDLLLRGAELTNNIGHIPKVLHHCCDGEHSVKKADASAKKALEDAMERRGRPAEVALIPDSPGCYRINYAITRAGKVSVVIPTKDHAKLLKTAVDSILQKTDYPDYEIIVLNNNSVSDEFFALMKAYEKEHPEIFRCIDANFPFNYARLMNVGVSESRGEYILMLNNDVEITDSKWMGQMVSYAQHEYTGAVGVKLLYTDNTIQHAGIVLGINGDAGHVFAHMHKDAPGYFSAIKTVTNYSAVTGACMMCRKSIFTEAGGMDEKLEVEYNDIDFCLKFLKHGYYNIYLPTVELYHHESATRGHPFRSKGSYKQHEKDLAIFKSKWQHFIDNDPFYNPNLSREDTDYRINY